MTVSRKLRQGRTEKIASLSDITNVTRTIGSEQLRSVIHDSY